MTATEIFELAIGCYLRELDDDEFKALTKRVRPPSMQVQRRDSGRACAESAKPTAEIA